MEVKLIKTLWGYEGPIDGAALARIKSAGFDGVETGVPPMEPAAWKDLLSAHGLVFCGQAFGFTSDEMIADLKAVAAYAPVVITCQDGRDKMSFEEGSAYFREVLACEADLGAPVAHETHRHRLLYTPWHTLQYVEAFEQLRLCADFSHWCVVTESMLADVDDMLLAASERTIHLHARVGYEEGPQVSDPRAPEWRPYLEQHETWWDRIYDLRKKAFAELLTVDPEFGPPRYMPTQPYSQMPVANLWDIHLWMGKRIRTRWAK